MELDQDTIDMLGFGDPWESAVRRWILWGGRKATQRRVDSEANFNAHLRAKISRRQEKRKRPHKPLGKYIKAPPGIRIVGRNGRVRIVMGSRFRQTYL